MGNLLMARALTLLQQARELREQVHENLRVRSFGADDVQMKAYNDLATAALLLLPDDPILGQLIVMPDGILQSYGTIVPLQSYRVELASKRLEIHLTRLINRLEVLLGEPATPTQAARPAGEVLRAEASPQVRAILDTLEKLRLEPPEVPPVEERDFLFVTSPELRQVLKLDFVEAQRAFAAGAFKACSLLAGGLIEGMLLDALQRPGVTPQPGYQQAVARFPKIGDTINWDRVSLTHLIHAAQELSLLEEHAARLTEGARDFRDTVHPNAEVRQGVRAKLEEAKLLLALVELIYRDLAGLSPIQPGD